MTQTQTVDFDFSAWRADQDARREALRARIVNWLERDQSGVWESWESASGQHSIMWYRGSGRFVAPYDTDAQYLADHLVSRHMGFGFTLEVGGRIFRMGREVSA